MAGDTMRFRNPAGHAGLLHNLVALLGTLAGFLESRAALFAKESKIALVQVLILVACLGAAVVLAFFGYLFLLASAVAGTGHGLHKSWVWIALWAGGNPFLLPRLLVRLPPSRSS